MEQLLVIAPIIAFVLVAIAIAVLWFWWSSGRAEEEPGANAATNGAAPLPLEDSMGAEIAGRLRNVLSAPIAWVSEKLRTRAMGRDMVSAMRLYRDVATGNLIVEMDGSYYHSLVEIDDPQVQRRLVGIAMSLSQLAGLRPGETPMVTWTPPSTEAPHEPPPPAQPVAAFLGQKDTAGTGKTEPPASARSMADEIEELLQLRLTQNTELSHRSVHIRPAEGGAIRVEVDGQSYDGVGSVTDEPIREFIQDIIRQWEARQ